MFTRLSMIIDSHYGNIDLSCHLVLYCRFIVYKMPKLARSAIKSVTQGIGYYYMDVNTPSWTLGQHSLNSTHQAIYHTLQQIYENNLSQVNMYNIF